MVMTVAARFGGKAVNLLAFLVLARTLSLEDLGVYGFLFATALLLATGFDFGVRNSVAYFIGKNPQDTATLTVQSLLLWVVFSLCCMVGMYVSMLYSPGNLTTPEYVVPSLVLVSSMLFLRMQQGVLFGQGRLKFYNTTELASRVVLLGTTIGLLVTHNITLDTALWSLALSQIVASIYLAWGVLPVARGGKWNDWPVVRGLLGRGFLFMIGVLVMLASKRLALLILSQLGSPDELGLFYGLQRLTEVLTEIGLAVAVVVFSSNVRSKSAEEAVETAAHSTRVSFALFSLITIVMFVGADLIVPIALGPEFAGHITMFRVVLIATLIGSVWTILFPSLSAINSPMLAFLIFLPHMLLNCVLIWVLYAAYGMMGAAYSVLIMNFGLTATFLIVFKLRYGVRIRDFLIPQRSDVDIGGFVTKVRRRLKRT